MVVDVVVDDDAPHVLNNFINCCTCVRDEARDLSNVAPLLFTDDTPVFIELIILMIPSKTPPFPVDDDDDDGGDVLVLVLAPVVVAVVAAVVVVDDSLLFVVVICGVCCCCCGTGCDNALPKAGIGAVGCGADCNGTACACCCCICCHC